MNTTLGRTAAADRRNTYSTGYEETTPPTTRRRRKRARKTRRRRWPDGTTNRPLPPRPSTRCCAPAARRLRVGCASAVRRLLRTGGWSLPALPLAPRPHTTATTSSGTDVLPRAPDRLQQEEPMEEEEVKEGAEEAEEEQAGEKEEVV
jgi:hypothetical protein